MGNNEHEDNTGVVTREQVSTKSPPLYRVLLINDDYTPMDFVIDVLQRFFRKNHQDAMKIMLAVHHEGQGLCGVYPRDIAETKVTQVLDAARKQGHPLQCTLEAQ